MIRIFIGAFVLFTAPYKVLSQKINGETLQPKTLLRFNILGLGDPLDQNLSFGLEQRFHSDWSTGTDAGWIFNSRYFDNTKRINGLIARPFIRYYPKKSISIWEAELHYKYVSYTIEDWLGRLPVNNIPAYEEFTTFKLNKHAAGIHFKWGIQSNLSSDKKLKFEFLSGLGMRYKWQKVRDGIYAQRGLGLISTAENSVAPVFLMNMRLVYALK